MSLLVFATLTFLLAGTIKGAVGIGLPTASIGILTQVIDPKIAIALVVIPAMISNAWQVYRTGDIIGAIKRYWIFAAALMLVVWLTTELTASISQSELLFVLGAVVIGFSLTSLFVAPPALPARFDKLAQAVFGSVAGLLGGLTAIWAPPMVIYLMTRRPEKDEFVRASGLLIFLGTLPLAAGFWQHGLLDTSTARLSALMVVPTLLGFKFGEMIRQRIKPEKFQTIVLVVFLFMGVNIIIKSLS